MKKVYHLSTCSTCQRILKEINAPDFVLQDIKTEAISESQLEEMYKFTSSYEALFSKRAMKYKSMALKDKNLQEDDFKSLILEEYTFLKRPVFIINDEVYVGNSKKLVEAVKNTLANE
jgi:arsenate reductase (glutaredoxin)